MDGIYYQIANFHVQLRKLGRFILFWVFWKLGWTRLRFHFSSSWLWGNGAVRPEFFRDDMKDADCSAFLQATLHAPLTGQVSAEDIEDAPVHGKTCHEEFGMCQGTRFCHGRGGANEFVKRFNRALLDNSVKVGDLLFATAGVSGESSFFFVGICLKRPTAHVLVEAHLQSDNSIRITPDDHGRPNISTSQQLFQGLVSRSHRAFRQISFELWSYLLVHNSRGPPFVKIEMATCDKKFTVDLDSKYKPRKPHFKLPFGLKLPKKQQKQQKGKKDKAKAKAKTQASKPKPKPKSLGLRQTQLDHNQSFEESSESSSSEPERGSESSSSSSSPSSDEGRCAEETEEREVVAVSKQAKEEETLARKLIAEQVQAKCAATTQGSYFTTEIGVDDVGLALSGRSKCYFCGEKIAKDSVRFAYHYSRQRPSNWVHHKCLAALVQRDQTVKQAISKLTMLLDKLDSARQASSSSAEPCPSQLADATRSVLSEIQFLDEQ